MENIKNAMAPVQIVMGRSSDFNIMKAAAHILTELGVEHDVRVLSAHRMASEMLEFGRSAAGTGIRVIIAGAGGAAHLPGMLAAVTTLPVIGVPVSLKNLSGLDSLLSIVQMPGGVPVAAVSIDGAKNAGLLAARILSLGDEGLRKRLENYQTALTETAEKQNEELRSMLENG